MSKIKTVTQMLGTLGDKNGPSIEIHYNPKLETIDLIAFGYTVGSLSVEDARERSKREGQEDAKWAVAVALFDFFKQNRRINSK